MSKLPSITGHEVIDFKRCPKKWYWKWRKGWVLKKEPMSALSLGTWVHLALDHWYTLPAVGRTTDILVGVFQEAVGRAINAARIQGVYESELAKAEEFSIMGTAMMEAYVNHYGTDSKVRTIAVEQPLIVDLEFDGKLIGHRGLKPDLIYRDHNNHVWLMEHKTASQIRTDHLVIDDQARPYGALAEMAMRKAGLIRKNDLFKGVMYNFLRKAFPDTRETNQEGHYLNKDGSVSKKQPLALFKRHPVTLTRPAKAATLHRVKNDMVLVHLMRQNIIEKRIDPRWLPKTPHYSCPRTCQYFKICVLEEEGADITDMRKSLYRVENPYLYYANETEDPPSFEMG